MTTCYKSLYIYKKLDDQSKCPFYPLSFFIPAFSCPVDVDSNLGNFT